MTASASREALTALSAEDKRELLARLLSERREDPAFRLSLDQQRLWFLRCLEPHFPAHVAVAYRVAGPIDPEILQRCANTVVARHEALRSTFLEVEGRPLRLRSSRGWCTVSTVDLTHLEIQDAEEELQRLFALDARTSFDFRDRLVRLTLVRIRPDSHVLVVTMHQIVADERSVDLFVREVADLHAAMRGNPALPIPASLPAPAFTEFVDREMRCLEDGSYGGHIEYWRRQLAGARPLVLAPDFPPPAVRVKATRGDRRSVLIPPDVSNTLLGIANGAGIRWSAALLSAFQVVLGRWKREGDVSVGWPVSERTDPAWHTMIGPLTAKLVIRTEVQGRWGFVDVMRQTDRLMSEALAHRSVPFEQLVRELKPERDPSHSPFFQVVFDDAHGDRERSIVAGDLEWERLDLCPKTSLFDLEVRVAKGAAGLTVQADFASDLWLPATIEHMLASLGNLLTEAAAEPLARVATLPLLTLAERRQALLKADGGHRPVPETARVHDLVAEAATRSPDAVALVCGDVRLTYADLDRRANQLARELRCHGAMPGTFVAVLADRTPEAVVGILGVLKTGAAYLPLDPSSPARRVEFVLSDANVVVVCARRALARVHPVRTRTLVELDFDAAWSSRDDTAPPADGCLDDLAYCIYTSGSSGRPRGVLVTHRQIACTTAARTHVYPAPSGGYLMLAPLFFDAACAGLFWVLSVGGKLIIPTDREVEDMRAIARLVRSHGVTHFDGVPSQYAVLLDTHGPALSQLECTILAGEVLPVAVAQLHCQAAPNAALFNEYGATEVSVWTSVFSYPRDFARYRVPVGRAIPNTRMHVLDEELEPVPPGVPAEIYVGGAGVALGYLGRPSLTAERFVPDPFGPPGARMYRMGDIGRLLPDGNTEFLGRLDGQIKVRGFRVEAGEIETALLTHPEIAGAAVVGRADGTSTQLTAYVVWKGSRPHEPSELSVFLRDRLPPYMIPSRFVPLEELPLTRQGKLDRRSLPDPRPSASASRTAPRTSLERDMERIIAEVLGLDSVGIDESFFELGGNSLHLAQIGARLSTTFGIDIPVHQFFTVPTVAGVCAVIELYRREGKESVLGSRRPSDVAAEAVLEAAIVPDGLPAAATDDPSAILLTGGTGYLGAFLLKELLEQTSADVHCLVRAPTRQDGMQRLRRVAKRFRVDLPEELWSRVRPLPGDLGRRCLGLPEETFEELATRIDLILHSGALVNFTYPYSVLMPPNVTGTHEVLRLATTGTLKSVHYISTMDVLIGSHTPRPFLETPLPPEPLRVPFSYPESKWVAEQLVSAAVSRGIPAAIYRPGMMMGHSRTGACHETDYLLVGMRGFLHMGILPEFPEIMNSITVDYASRALVELLKQPSSTGRIFHLWNLDAVPTMTTYDWIRSFGYRFEIVPYDTALERAMGLQLDHPLYPLLPVLFLYRSGQAGTHLTWEDHQTIDHISECENTLNALGNCGLDCPALDERWMHMCLDFLVASGVLEPPDRMGAQHAH